MGNTCVGPNVGNNGFLQSVSAAVWRQRGTEELVPTQKEADGSSKASAAAAATSAPKESQTALPVQSTPPEPVTISEEVPKRVEAISSDKPGEKVQEAKPVEPTKPKKPPNFKRMASVGLNIDSVLQRKTEILKEKYSLGRKLGQGQFGTTFYCLEKGTGKEFACKTIAKRKLTTAEDVEDVRREIQIMHHLAGHPNIISIVGAFEDAVGVHVVMELCAGGELFDRIIQRGHYSEKQAAELARVIVGVVEACHSLGVMHRDLKPENFLFVSQGDNALLKTIDFGLSIFFRPGKRSRESLNRF
uniref:non-specific serine/threonine protein kinase n=1 Tax=Nelumbo nucifera TaxID=4432 RepID=A0A822ZXN0_NELNU|nr:TPA_asm: hypothetical protein HUJ06_018218 [Nelumbo nucifera]